MITDAQIAAAMAAHTAEHKLWVVRMMGDAWGYKAFREGDDILTWEIRCGTDRLNPTIDQARSAAWLHVDQECWRKALEAAQKADPRD